VERGQGQQLTKQGTKNMTRKTLLAAGILLAATSAQALELSCGAPNIIIGTQSRDRADTVTGVEVTHTEENGWRIIHVMGNGSLILRGIQYDIRDTSDRNMTQWRGLLLKRSSHTMIGEIKRENKTGRYVYIEWGYDNGKLTMNSAAYCRDGSQASAASTMAPVPSQPESEPEAPKGWPKWLKE
jgi:hypothetical protein